MNSPTRLASIGDVPRDLPPGVYRFLGALKETIEVRNGQRGDPLDQAITFRSIGNTPGVKISLMPGGTPAIDLSGIGGDLTQPPAITDLAAVGALASILLSWSLPKYKNHAYTEVWRASTNALGQAVKIGMAPGSVYSDSVGTAATFYYWVRAVSTSNVAGPFNAVSGVQGQTSHDPSFLLQMLNGAITESQLYTALGNRISLIDAPGTGLVTQVSSLNGQYTVKIDNNGYVSGFGLASTGTGAAPSSSFIVRADSFAIGSPSGPGITPSQPFIVQTTPTVVNGITVPAGVYMSAAFIMAGTITKAMIGLAAIDDARISDLSAAKITAGTIGADRLDANVITSKVLSVDAAKITTGYLDVARIADGTLGIAKITSVISSSNYVAGSAGWSINQNGLAEFNNITVRGTVTGSTITGSNISGTNITGGSLNINNLFLVNSSGQVTIQSATSGGRLVITNSLIQVIDGNGVVRVKMGQW